MGAVSKVSKIYHTVGIAGLCKRFASYCYRNYLRPMSPSIGYVWWAEVQMVPKKLLDYVVPSDWLHFSTRDSPLYEDALIAGLKEQVRPNDHVVIIGSGFGVTAVIAARLVGQNGSVTCFEAVAKRVKDTRRTARLNKVSKRVHVNHAIVARAIALFGISEGASIVAPEDIPPCDVLEMDCEGAEIEILQTMTIRPRVILVETHGSFGAPTAEVQHLLQQMSYTVRDMGIAESAQKQACIDGDIHVLSAHL